MSGGQQASAGLKGLVGLPGGGEGWGRRGAFEHFGGELPGEGFPGAANKAVEEDDREEGAGVVVGVVLVVLGKDQAPAFVADQVFVVGGQQDGVAAAEAPGAGIFVKIEVHPFPVDRMQFIPESGDTPPAVADVQAGPPSIVFERRGAVASEVFPGQQRERFVLFQRAGRGDFCVREGVGGFRRMEVSAAQRPGEFCHPDVVGKPVVIHPDIPFGKRLGKIFFRNAPFVGGAAEQQVADLDVFFVRNADTVGAHPSFDDLPGLGGAQGQHPAVIFPADQLPGAAQQMKPDDPAAQTAGKQAAGTASGC